MPLFKELVVSLLSTAFADQMLVACGSNQSVIGKNEGRLGDGRFRTALDVPDPRYNHSAVWTGTEMIVWGGVGAGYLGTGWRYDPTGDTWTAVATADAPSPRQFHTAIWTGNEMIVWGGFFPPNSFNTGGRYDPATETRTSTNNAPSVRSSHKAVWTGSKMIVWGGYDDLHGLSLNTGGSYDPVTDTWTRTNTTKRTQRTHLFHVGLDGQQDDRLGRVR